jgi:hypothetical protein
MKGSIKTMSAIVKIFRCGALVLVLLATAAIAAAQDNSRKLEYAILVDSTGSMRGHFDSMLDLGKSIVDQVHDHGPVSVYRFRSARMGPGSPAIATRIIDRTQDKDQLYRAIEGIYIEGGQTTLLDAVDLMADNLNQPPIATEKVLILITDGEDRISKTDRKELIGKLTANNTHIYAIGLVGELEGGKRSKAIDLLKLLAKETGGRAVFPKSIELKSLFTELSIPIQ